MAMADTKDLILDAAEQLFAENGFDATSLREITARAGVNLAAVNYHFQSKEALLLAVMGRRIRAVNERRIQLLDVLEAEFPGDGPVPVEQVVELFIVPVLQAKGIGNFRRLLGRMYSESGQRVQVFIAGEMTGFADRFLRALSRALPHLPIAELHWRIHFLVGVMAHMLGAEPLIQAVSGEYCDPADTEAMIPHMISFLVAGLQAPAPELVEQ